MVEGVGSAVAVKTVAVMGKGIVGLARHLGEALGQAVVHDEALGAQLEGQLGGAVERIGLGALARGHVVALEAHPVEPRSEEHTSELQSLMRISYAVFCLKKKNKSNSS